MAGRGKKKEQLTVRNIRAINKKNILRQLVRVEEQTRNDLAEVGKISLMTVKHIVDELVESGIVEERACEASVGRKPKALSFAPKYGNIVCINLTSAESLRYIIYNIHRKVLFQDEIRFKKGERPYTQERLIGLTSHIKEKMEEIPTATVGIAVSVPSAYYEEEDLVNYDLIPEFKDFHIGKFMKTQFGIDNVVVLHDVFSAAKSEYESKTPRPESQFYFYCGYGVGGCFINQGIAIRGKDRVAGEVGKLLMENPFTHKTEDLEQIISVPGILEEIHKILPGLEFEEALKQYKAGNEKIMSIMDLAMESVSQCLYNIIWIYNPVKIVVDSCYKEYAALLEQKVKEFLVRFKKDDIYVTTEVEQAKYDEYHIMRGCFRAALETWIDGIANKSEEV